MVPFDKKQVRHTQLDLWTSNVNTLRKECTFTDVVIQCGTEEIHAHRIVLAAGSPFFHTMLQSSMTEASTGRIQLQTLDPDAIEIVVNFIYTGEIMPIEDDVGLTRAVLEAAHMLQILALFEYALQVLRSRLNYDYFMDLLEIAELYDIPLLQEQVLMQVAYQLENSCHAADFQRLSSNHIQKIIAHPVLSTTTLDIIVEGVINWARGDVEGRLPVLVTILETLDLTQLSCETIQRLLNSEKIVKNVDKIMNLLGKAAIQYSGWSPFQSSKLTATSNLICYGKSSNHESLYSVFDCKTNCFRVPTPMSTSLPEDTTAVAYNGSIYFIGGVNETGMSKTVLRFYPQVKTIVNFSKLCHEVSDTAAIVFQRKIYAIGGFDVYRRHSRMVQCLDPISSISTDVAPTSKLHRYPFVGHIANHIYVIGTKLNDQHIERYNPNSDQWTVVSVIPDPVCGCGGAFGKLSMYCVPDCNKPSEMWSCNPSALVWKKHCLKNCPVSFQGRWTISMNGTDEFVLFVTDEHERIHCYVPGSNTWLQLSVTDVPASRNAPPSMMCVMGFCVV